MPFAPSIKRTSRTHYYYYYLLLMVIFIIAVCECYVTDDVYGGNPNRSSDSISYDDDEYSSETDLKGPNRHRHYRKPYDVHNCCRFVFGLCRTLCENLSLANLASNFTGKDIRIKEIRHHCPPMQKEYWICINRTLDAVARAKDWSGRLCCPLANTIKCQNVCATSSNPKETLNGCRRSDEQSLFECFDRYELGDDCCGNARSSECLHACQAIFQSQRPVTNDQRKLLDQVCSDNHSNSKVLQCIKQVIDLTPVKNIKQYMPCCAESKSALCRETCKNILEIGETTQEIIDTLERGGCGLPMPHEPLWQCFLSGNKQIIGSNVLGGAMISQINQIGMDSAKLHCCHKAIAPKCRRLCLQTFSNEWSENRNDFDIDCYEQFNEFTLRQCLDEVDEPCKLGCDGLSFCTNFNNRPTELFRSCNIQTDSVAKANLIAWKNNQSIILPGLVLPIKDITKCSTESWQAISCVLQIKPCSPIKHSTQICREDCYDLLTKCIEWSRMETRHTPESICERFSIDETPCISLKSYLEPSDLPINKMINHQIILPCRGHMCNDSEICIVNRNTMLSNENDELYQCVAGCPLGETSSYLIPVGSYARIPVSLKQKDCFKVCRCSASGRLDTCSNLQCITYDSCQFSDRIIEHGSWFRIECNICSCFAGDITCTKKQCRIAGLSDHSYTSLPCKCSPHYVPNCGPNGYTYPSVCVAKCAGLIDSNVKFGACRNNDPCKGAKCNSFSQCIENRQICLSVSHRCRQYQCVNTTSCRNSNKPVCGADAETYQSMCHLIKAKVDLAYTGECRVGCKITPICGINGISYKSECEAWSDYSLADYDGVCNKIGLLTDSLGDRCPGIKCQALSCSSGVITPPGACCPVCGGAIRIIYSRKQIDRALTALKDKNNELLSLKGVLRALEGLVDVLHCQLSGFLSIENDIFVLIHSMGTNLSSIQNEACVKEAEKIAALIDTQSHRITSDLALSILTVANIERPKDYNQYLNNGNRNTQNIALSFAIIISKIVLSLYEK